MNRENISEELKNLGSSLAGLSRRMPYQVPSGYFEQFRGSLQQTTDKLNEPESAPEWGKSMPFAVPDGYFNDLAATLAAKAKTGKESPSQIEVPLRVPAGYFGMLPEKMLAAAKATEPEKRVIRFLPFKCRKMIRPIRWAAAAILIVTIGVGAFEGYYSHQPYNPDKVLASVDNSDIQDYLQHTYRVDPNRITENNDISKIPVDNKEIIQYLDETGWDITD